MIWLRLVAFVAIALLAGLKGQELPAPWVAVYHPAEQWRVGAPQDEGVQLASGSLAEVRSSLFYYSSDCLDVKRAVVRLRAEAGGEWRDAEVLERIDCSGLRVRLPELPVGRAQIAFHYDGARIGAAVFEIVESYFAILGPVGDESGRRVALAKAAVGGGVISILGTGLGDARREEIHAELDGTALTLVDTRRAVSGAAMDVLRFRLPDTLPVEGCYVPVAVSVGDRWSELVPVAVSRAGGACRHPLGLTVEQMTVLDSGRSIGLGQVQFSSQGANSWGQFAASVDVAGVDAVMEVSFERYGEGCQAFPPYRWSATPVVQLRAGAITARGPDGKTANAGTQVQGGFAAGDYAVRATGGADVMPFAVGVRVPEVPALMRGMRLLESGELLMEWDGARYAEGDWVSVSASGWREVPGFLCRALARGGRMVIPGRAERIGRVDVAVERDKRAPLLFPVMLRNGVSFPGVVDYRISEGVPVWGLQ